MAAFSAADGAALGEFAADAGIASQRPYQRGERTITSSPALTRDLLLFGGNDGYLYVLNRHTLAMGQRFYIGAPIPASPAVTGNAVIVAAYDGNVYAFSSAR